MSKIRVELSEVLFYGGLLTVLIAVAFCAPPLVGKLLWKLERAVARLARRRGWAMVVVGLASFALVVGLAMLLGLPCPNLGDDFGYLLNADTFLQGRLTNPPHPLWMHFETPHILQKPTYASTFMPGQSLALAVGYLLGHPIIGVWLSTALACAAICWMLMAWLPARWAVVGGIMAAVHPEILIWNNVYWGPTVALGGGALALGGWWRVLHRQRVRDAVLMAAGMGMSVISRSYEGGVLTLTLLAILIVRLAPWKHSSPWVVVARVGVPLLAVLAIAAVWLSYYNWRITGNAFLFPYQLHRVTYAVAPTFFWQKAMPEPVYRHQEMREFYTGWELRAYTKQHAPGGNVARFASSLWTIFRGNLRLWFLAFALLALPAALKRQRWMLTVLLVYALVVLAVLQPIRTSFRYTAPAFGLFFLVAMESLRYLSLWRWHGRRVGWFLARGSLIWCVLSPIHTYTFLKHIHVEGRPAQRVRMLTELERQGGRHLVIVRYSEEHNTDSIWIHNKADIDGATVVWAREMDADHNRKIIEYFKGRRIWLLDTATEPPELVPYPLTTDD